MEPTIYNKPSIYKGAGVYKTGAEGGGGGGGGLQPDEIVIGEQVLGTTQINDQIWTTKNFDFVLPGITYNNGETYPIGPHCWYYNRDSSTYGIYGQNRGMLYTYHTQAIIKAYLEEYLPGWRIPTKSDFDKLISFAGGKNNSMPKLCAKRLWANASSFTDDFNLSLIPTGRRDDDHYDGLATGFYWTSTKAGMNYITCRVGEQNETEILTTYTQDEYYDACAYRFVKDA